VDMQISVTIIHNVHVYILLITVLLLVSYYQAQPDSLSTTIKLDRYALYGIITQVSLPGIPYPVYARCTLLPSSMADTSVLPPSKAPKKAQQSGVPYDGLPDDRSDTL
jgi:hypothetical protein